jgi:hypothetical protein
MFRRLTLACLFYLWLWDGTSTTLYRLQATASIYGPQWTYRQSFATETACRVAALAAKAHRAKCLPATLDPTQQ